MFVKAQIEGEIETIVAHILIWCISARETILDHMFLAAQAFFFVFFLIHFFAGEMNQPQMFGCQSIIFSFIFEDEFEVFRSLGSHEQSPSGF